MSRFNSHFIFILFSISFCAGLCSAQTESLPQEKLREFKTISVNYTSWTEFADLESNNFEDSTNANFFGVQLTFEKESFDFRHGFTREVSLLFGQANLGGRQRQIAYQTNRRSWYGLEASYRGAFRLSPQITLSAGPLLLLRQIDWPAEGTDVTVKSGAPINLGMMADAKLRMTPRWEIHQMIGTLFFKASTIWSLGVGYKY